MGLYVVVGLPLAWVSIILTARLPYSLLMTVTAAEQQPAIRQKNDCQRDAADSRELGWHHVVFHLVSP
jgi:hypothetical protein